MRLSSLDVSNFVLPAFVSIVMPYLFALVNRSIIPHAAKKITLNVNHFTSGLLLTHSIPTKLRITQIMMKDNLKKKSAEELSKVTGGLNLPLDFKLPF